MLLSSIVLPPVSCKKIPPLAAVLDREPALLGQQVSQGDHPQHFCSRNSRRMLAQG
jgi:hypothetical protein